MNIFSDNDRVRFERLGDKLIAIVNGVDVCITTHLSEITEGDDKGKYRWNIEAFSISDIKSDNYYPDNTSALELSDVEESVRRYISRYVRD